MTGVASRQVPWSANCLNTGGYQEPRRPGHARRRPVSEMAAAFCSSVIVCFPPSWFSMEQRVDLKAEGLWEELLDAFQPEIEIQDW